MRTANGFASGISIALRLRMKPIVRLRRSIMGNSPAPIDQRKGASFWLPFSCSIPERTLERGDDRPAPSVGGDANVNVGCIIAPGARYAG